MEDFVKKLAFYFSEINALHPFREGSGRTQREFIRQLAIKNGYIISFADISPEEIFTGKPVGFLVKKRLPSREALSYC